MFRYDAAGLQSTDEYAKLSKLTSQIQYTVSKDAGPNFAARLEIDTNYSMIQLKLPEMNSRTITQTDEDHITVPTIYLPSPIISASIIRFGWFVILACETH